MRFSFHEFVRLFLLGSVALVTPCHELLADEGMWLFNAVPAERQQQQYQFTPSPAWLEHLQRSSVRFSSGGSGSIVSPDDLVLTNHHVGVDALQKLSDASHNYARDGFYAGTRNEEKRCLDLELTVVRVAAELPKPNGERLQEFQDSNRAMLEPRLFSEAPIYDDLERLTLADC